MPGSTVVLASCRPLLPLLTIGCQSLGWQLSFLHLPFQLFQPPVKLQDNLHSHLAPATSPLQACRMSSSGLSTEGAIFSKSLLQITILSISIQSQCVLLPRQGINLKKESCLPFAGCGRQQTGRRLIGRCPLLDQRQLPVGGGAADSRPCAELHFLLGDPGRAWLPALM